MWSFIWPCGCWPKSFPNPKPLRNPPDLEMSGYVSQSYRVKCSSPRPQSSLLSLSTSPFGETKFQIGFCICKTTCLLLVCDIKRPSSANSIDLISLATSSTLPVCTPSAAVRGRWDSQHHLANLPLCTLSSAVEVQSTAFHRGSHTNVGRKRKTLSVSPLSLTGMFVNV